MVKALVTVSILLIGMLVIAHGARELQQVVRSGSAQSGQVYGAQSTPVTTLNGGNGGGNSGNSGNSGNANAPSSGNDDSDSGNGNASNNAAGRQTPTLIRKDLGSSNAYVGG